MTSPDWIPVISALGSTALALWMAVSSSREKQRNTLFKQQLELRDKKQEAKREQWQEDDRVHKRRMEELGLASIRQGNVAATRASEAVQAAQAVKMELKKEISDSRTERREQFNEIKEASQTAFDAANNTNGKLLDLGLQLIPPATNPPPDL